MRKYYLHDGISQQGPFTIEELKQKQLTPDAHIWFEGLGEWTPAGRLGELKELFGAVPPPFRSSMPPQFNQPLPSYYDAPEPSKPSQKPLVIGATIGVVAIVAAVLYFTSFKSDAASSNRPLQIGANGPEGVVNQVDSNAIKLQALEEKERQRQVANEARTKQNMEYRNNFGKYIEFSTNKNYRISSWGGVYGLEVYVTNNTDKVLDEVVVTITYFLENGEYWGSKDISISNIQPGSYGFSKVPDTGRGTRFEADISKITAKSLHFCYDNAFTIASMNGTVEGISGNPADPWFCK